MARSSKLAMLKIDQCIARFDNPRIHPDEQIDALIKSLSEFGFQQPVIVDANHAILAGHGRIMAAKKIYESGHAIPNIKRGYIPAVVVSGLSDEEKQAYIIADNKLASLSEFDASLLALELEELRSADFDICVIGFSAADIERINEDLMRERLRQMGVSASPIEQDDAAPSQSDGPRNVTLKILIPAVDRQIVYDALSKAKARHRVETSGDALVAIIEHHISHARETA